LVLLALVVSAFAGAAAGAGAVLGAGVAAGFSSTELQPMTSAPATNNPTGNDTNLTKPFILPPRRGKTIDAGSK
jgi:hypothetical protein